LQAAHQLLQPLEATTCQTATKANGHDAQCENAPPLLAHVRYLLADLEQAAARHENVGKEGAREVLVEGAGENREENRAEGGGRERANPRGWDDRHGKGTRGEGGVWREKEMQGMGLEAGGAEEEVESIGKEVEEACGSALALLQARDASLGPQVWTVFVGLFCLKRRYLLP